ncbi:MAG TPA: CGNR zinc finger domain-containing protein [Actinomycetota bacterium]|nr:CGNR zinc finger domain-containing protein [Actinomycetota bacterium]
MDFSHYSDQCIMAAADLVNTRGHPSGREHMGTPELAARFLADHGFSGAEHVSAEDLTELHRVRDRLEDVFFAGDDQKATGIVNDLLSEYEVKPHLTDHDGRWHFHYAPEDTPIGRRVASDVVMGVATLIADYGFERFGICAADDCEDVFVDTSRNRSRRYCNDVCSSRTNVAAYRARAKAKTRG